MRLVMSTSGAVLSTPAMGGPTTPRADTSRQLETGATEAASAWRGRRARQPSASWPCWRMAVPTVALQLIVQCAIVEAQTTGFANGGRLSYTQPEEQGGVLTRTTNGPPYRDVNDAVRSSRRPSPPPASSDAAHAAPRARASSKRLSDPNVRVLPVARRSGPYYGWF
jgi:hypothetical protein